jgi:hypothetical protein
MEKLVDFLPNGTKKNLEDFSEELNSYQFGQTIKLISNALKNGQLSGFMHSLGLDPNLGLLGGNLIE